MFSGVLVLWFSTAERKQNY